MKSKYIIVYLFTLLLITALIIFVYYREKSHESKKNDMTNFDLTDKQKLEKILELEKSSMEIIKFDEIINKEESYGKIKAEVVVNEKELDIIKQLLEKKYKLHYSIYSCEFDEPGYIGYGTAISKKNLDSIADNKTIREYFGERYDEYFIDGFFRVNINLDIEEFNNFIEQNIKKKDKELYVICHIYSDELEIIKEFCNMVGVDTYEFKNDYDLFDKQGENIYDASYVEDNHLYYWFDKENKCHIFIEYQESSRKNGILCN